MTVAAVTTAMALRGSEAFHDFNTYGVYRDDKPLYFGSDGDASVKYNSTDDVLEISGVGVRFSGGLGRKITSVAITTSLTDAQVAFGLVEVTASGRTMHLPAAASTNKNADVIVGPVGAFGTIVDITGAGNFGGSAVTSVTVPAGATAQFISDGTRWFLTGVGGSLPETLAIADLSDVSAVTGTGATVVFSASPTISAPWIDQVNGSAIANGTLTLASTSHATKGEVIIAAGSRFKLGTFAADPGTLVDGDVWYDTALTRFRGRENGITFTFATETSIPGHVQTGANAAAKIQAAIDAASSGDVVDCSRVTGTVSSTVTINKKITVIVGTGLALSANPSFILAHGAGANGTGDGAILRGASSHGTLLTAAAGITAIRVEADYGVVKDLGITFAGANASNLGIQVRKDSAATYGCVRPVIDNVRIDLAGALGSAVTFQVVYGGILSNSEFRGAEQGIWAKDDGVLGGCTALVYHNVRCFGNVYGIRYTNIGGAKIGMASTVEGNSTYGVWIESGDGVESFGNHYENTGSATNIFVTGINDGFQRSHFSFGDTFVGGGVSKAIQIGAGGAGQLFYVTGGSGAQGFTATTGQIIVKSYGIVAPGVHSGNVINEQYTSAAGTTYYDTGLSTINKYVSGWLAVNYDTPVVVNFSGVASVNFTVKGASTGSGPDSALIATDASATVNAVGFGMVPLTGGKAWVANTFHPTSGTARGLSVIADWNPSGNTTAGCEGVSVTSRSHNANTRTFASIYGLNVLAQHGGTNTAAIVIAETVVASNSSTGTASSLRCLDISATQDTAGGTTTEAVGINLLAPTVTAGTMTTWTALRIINPTGATFNTAVDIQGGDMLFNSGSHSPLFLVYGVGDSFPGNMTFRVDTANARVQIGGALAGLGKFGVSETSTATSATPISNYFSYTLAPGGASSANWRDGLFEAVKTGNNNVTGSITAIEGDVYSNATGGTITTAYGGIFKVINQGAGGTITTAIGALISVQNTSSGTITAGAGIEIGAPVNSGGGTFGTWYGLIIDAPTAAAANYAIYVAGGFVHFNAGADAVSDFCVSGDTDTLLLYVDVSADKVGIGTATPAYKLDVAGSIHTSGRLLGSMGAGVASANDLTLGTDGNTFLISGNTQINAITTAGWTAGSFIYLIFSSTPTVKHNTAGGAGTAKIFLAGAADFVASAEDSLTLMYDGTNWRQLAVAVI